MIWYNIIDILRYAKKAFEKRNAYFYSPETDKRQKGKQSCKSVTILSRNHWSSTNQLTADQLFSDDRLFTDLLMIDYLLISGWSTFHLSADDGLSADQRMITGKKVLKNWERLLLVVGTNSNFLEKPLIRFVKSKHHHHHHSRW